MASSRFSFQANGLTTVKEDPNTSQAISQRAALKRNMFRHLRPPPLKYAWTFYHNKHSDGEGNYEGQLTVLLENIVTVKPFWESYNNYPIDRLKMKDSIHYFKRGVKPVWEDPRNVNGGAWTFRVPKDKSQDFWKEVVMFAMGDSFADVIQPKDDLCGITFSTRFNSNLIQVWNRDGSNAKSRDGILNVILANLSEELKPKDGSPYYKRHSEHHDFADVIARAKAAKLAETEKDKAGDSGRIEEAVVTEEEAHRALAEEEKDEEAEA